ncbi:peroxisome biogenesis factor 10 [Cymbomonas tetramitiformis]|uniref:RING-type E3 ubiquitin transferase n=1 Tax=Cymbomonas tetramitiformis TaxID=36881 RepID=A0AAE0H0B2_9CHLO|nr:peroxisome biogenesis factor 10 [Cymbomonas tetramitiformis]
MGCEPAHPSPEAGRELRRYSMLGVIVLMQLSITSCLWMQSKVLPQIWDGCDDEAGSGEVVVEGDDDDCSASLAESGDKQTEGEVPSWRKCPLCLSVRTTASATPCGHVFCWECAVEWCSQKPECPLCRAPAQPWDLVRLCHSDF